MPLDTRMRPHEASEALKNLLIKTKKVQDIIVQPEVRATHTDPVFIQTIRMLFILIFCIVMLTSY